MGGGNTVVGASTYGYPYPRYPEGAVPVRRFLRTRFLLPVWSVGILLAAAYVRFGTVMMCTLRLLFAIAPLMA